MTITSCCCLRSLHDADAMMMGEFQGTDRQTIFSEPSVSLSNLLYSQLPLNRRWCVFLLKKSTKEVMRVFALSSLVCAGIASLPEDAQAFVSSTLPAAIVSSGRSLRDHADVGSSIGVCNNVQRDRIYGAKHLKRSLVLYAAKRGGAMARKKSKEQGGKTGTSSDSSGGGFGGTSSKPTDASMSGLQGSRSQQGEGGREIYSLPALYDLAFGYRNYEEEVDFLLNAHRKYSGQESTNGPSDILELAVGPARHSISCLRENGGKIKSVTAVDLSSDMVQYGKENADQELGDAGTGGLRDAFSYLQEDMRSYCLGDGKESRRESLDSAWILLGSMQHLVTNDDVIDCFQSTANALRPGGTLIIELPHPRETFTMVECTRNGWEVPLEDDEGTEYGELKVIWGDDDDPFDPIRQVRDFTVALELTGVDENDTSGEMKKLQSMKEVVPMRLFTAQEMDALARCAGLRVVAMYGALSEEVAVDSDNEAFRLVCIMRKE